ncbi:CD1871A family CXXC motif-containing protein [Desulfobulbus rhabdoformis]|nr:CD1871A family CXXC motif-containing protein [Desulfobulbus rhabdoformis]
MRTLPLVTMAIFLGLVLLGISLGEPERVLQQARSICLACIGIG